jgi:hypothetical protein
VHEEFFTSFGANVSCYRIGKARTKYNLKDPQLKKGDRNLFMCVPIATTVDMEL